MGLFSGTSLYSSSSIAVSDAPERGIGGMITAKGYEITGTVGYPVGNPVPNRLTKHVCLYHRIVTFCDFLGIF